MAHGYIKTNTSVIEIGIFIQQNKGLGIHVFGYRNKHWGLGTS
jgi:hypothetical protein